MSVILRPQRLNRRSWARCDYALERGHDRAYLRAHAGEVFGYLAYGHPFLEGNGRTILTVFAELTRRAGFFVRWEEIDKDEFLQTLTDELLQPGNGTLDGLIARYTNDEPFQPA